MTDIVERLRAIKKLPLDLQTVTEEAADEIERLREARAQALGEAARFVEENYEEPFVNIVGNQSWRERGAKKLAAAIRALKDKQ